jgi:hypothetical protein
MDLPANCSQGQKSLQPREKTRGRSRFLAAVRKALRMVKPVSYFNAALRVWAAFIGTICKRSARIHGVFLHDPQADRPKNLDNPFHDAGAQERVGDLIARSTRSAERKPPK